MITREQAIEFGNRWGNTTLYHVTLRNSDGSAVRARTNGKCKVWKRDLSRFQLPMKHGLRDCFYLTESNASEWLTDDPTEEAREREFRHKRIVIITRKIGMAEDTPLPILHDALVDKGEDGLAKLVLVWLAIDARKPDVSYAVLEHKPGASG